VKVTHTGWFVLAGLVVALALAFGVSRYASSQPDGLEKVAADRGLDTNATAHPLAGGPFVGYETRGVKDPEVTTGVAGVVGVVTSFLIAGGLARMVVRRRGTAHDANARSLAPRVKLVALLLFVVAVVITPARAVPAFAGYVLLIVLAARFVGIRRRELLKRMMIEIPFLIFALALPFVATGPRHAVLGVSVSIAGTWAAWNILAKASLGVAASIILTWSTPVADMLDGLDQLHVPRALTTIAGFMVRYLDVVVGELHRLGIARVSRGDDPRWAWQGKAVAATAGTLFVRSYERGERVHHAMLARGYDGRVPSSPPSTPERWWPAMWWPTAALAIATASWWVLR
jgi:cobalt/nickel transport system permease protein